MTATAIDLSAIKTDALSAASTFRTLIGLGTLATQSPTGTANSTTYLRGDFTWQTISAGASWGSITGTLSSQTDLQNALDAKASLSGATFTGRITTPSVLLSGNYSSTAWTTSGVGLSHTARTLTDTSSTGTVATAYTNVLGGNTIAASNATTFTDYASLFIGSPTAGSNVTITNAFSLITQGAVRIGGQLLLTNALSVANGGTGSTTASGAANAILPSQTSSSGKYLTTDGSNVSWGSASAAVMTGATASTSGSSGSVPTPAAGQEELMLTGAGTFHVPSLPIVKSETTRGTSTSRWLSAPFAQDAGAGSSGGANFEFCGAFLYVPYTGSYYFATIPAAAYSGSTKTSWALYNLASDGLPGTLAVTLGELDVGAGANVLCQSASTVSLTKGWYCCVHRANGSFNLWAPQSHAWLNYTYGKITADISNVSAAGKRRFYRALTYSTSFASDLTSQTWSEDNNASPCCWIRRG